MSFRRRLQLSAWSDLLALFASFLCISRVPNGSEVGNIGVRSAVHYNQFLCWYDHSFGVHQNVYAPKRDVSSQVWTTMTRNPQLIHGTGERWLCDLRAPGAAGSLFMTEFVLTRISLYSQRTWTRRCPLSVRPTGTQS